MPLNIGFVEIPQGYTISYQKKNEIIIAEAPTKDDAKELMEWIGAKTGLIPAP